MSTAIILAGHGSHISPNTAGIVWQYVDELRRRGVADEVVAAFWKEAPGFHAVLNSIEADEVVIVPVFTTQGYFTEQVIPAEFGLTGCTTHIEGRVVRYARTIGEHTTMADIINQRVQQALFDFDLDPTQTAVGIIGHGTKRNPNSRLTTRQQADLLRKAGIVSSVRDIYLDDDPNIPSLYDSTTELNLIAVPFFLAEGSHTTIDVPNALGLPNGQQRASINSREVVYTHPIGTDPRIPNLLLDLVTETGFPLSAALVNHLWEHLPTNGLQAFTDRLNHSDRLEIGQLEVTSNHVRRLNDQQPNPIIITTPAELRATVREQPFRPWATTNDLPGGWLVPITSAEQAFAVIETVYPSLLADWAAAQRGEFITNTIEQVATRQIGVFRRLLDLTTTEIHQTIQHNCGRCVREPTWHQSTLTALPCTEPCNWWMSHAEPKEKKHVPT